MDITVIGLIGIGLFGLVYVIYTSAQKNKEKKVEANAKQKDIVTNNEIKRNNNKDVQKKDMNEFMEFDKIVDNMILQENENKYTMVVQCKGINYDLMSDIEQLAVEEGFITFLNTLKYPVQLYVQARAIDLKNSMDLYKEGVADITTQYYAAEDRLNKVNNDINSTNREVQEATIEKAKYANILEYAQDITKYVERMSLNKHVLQRRFYVIVSYHKSELGTTSEFTKKEIYDMCYRELYVRAQTIISALASCSVTGKVLTSNELAELLYISYNRDDEQILDIRTALESGFYRLYSTSQDVFEKREQLMKKEIQEEGARRVRAAIKETLSGNDVKTPEQLEDDFEEQVDRQALEIIRNADIDEESKENLSNIIAERHVENAEKRKEERRMKQHERENIETEGNQEEDGENQENETGDSSDDMGDLVNDTLL